MTGWYWKFKHPVIASRCKGCALGAVKQTRRMHSYEVASQRGDMSAKRIPARRQVGHDQVADIAAVLRTAGLSDQRAAGGQRPGMEVHRLAAI